MQPNDLGLDFVRLLEPISFTWKDSRSDNPRRSFGIRVEDVENAIETLGIENSGIVCIPDYEKLSEEEREEAPKHVEETSMIAMLISAIKQLDAKVADLEEKLKAKE
jgi:sugar phosphate isomerase/epimerase